MFYKKNTLKKLFIILKITIVYYDVHLCMYIISHQRNCSRIVFFDPIKIRNRYDLKYWISLGVD